MDTEHLDWDEIKGKGSAWLGSMPVQEPGKPEQLRTLYAPLATKTQKLADLVAVVELACVPLPDEAIVKGLSTIAVLCKAKAMDEDEQTMSLGAFLERLRDYPADAVAFALNEWPEHNIFQPSWVEMKRMVLHHCWMRLRVRERLTAVLQIRRETD